MNLNLQRNGNNQLCRRVSVLGVSTNGPKKGHHKVSEATFSGLSTGSGYHASMPVTDTRARLKKERPKYNAPRLCTVLEVELSCCVCWSAICLLLRARGEACVRETMIQLRVL